MRIIAGKFKGRKIQFVSDEKTRPTADMVREGLFSKIQFDVPDSRFLDLFAGSGSVGLEALSRGAREVIFVENDKKNCEIIRKNLIDLYGKDFEKQLKTQNQNVSIINADCFDALENLSDTFEFVYIDPPYKSNLYSSILQELKSSSVLTDDSLIICEHEHNIKFEYEGYQLITQKKYGIKMLSYFKLS
jgi:16S rRNA (guanine966-N2)-methyltransferase